VEAIVFRLPNVRKIFIPDRGYIIFEADLSGADAQVVAWEADDVDLKTAFRNGLDVHSKNAEEMWGDAFSLKEGVARKVLRQQNKVAVHATNYLTSPRTMSATLGWSLSACESFQRRWFERHPKIKAWHRRVERGLSTNRQTRNQFGYRIIFYDRIDNCLTEAVAWTPQSTVAEVCFRGALQLQDKCPWVELLLQVHDSLVFQIPSHRSDCIPQIRAALPVPVPYSDPLVIPWGLKSSEKSWGDCKDVQI
jgi:DNA polymerase-1